ncbi:MAG TPA: pilin [Candidatus Dormibacteraeota bacterium]|nr:pilin [Candidatus Dormibacteraeota bacterium]
MKKLTYTLALVACFSLSSPALAAGPLETIKNGACEATQDANKVSFLAGCNKGNQSLDKPSQNAAGDAQTSYLATLLDLFIFAASIVAIAFIVIGGIKYITSTGDPTRIANAKNTILYAIIGLIVAIIARAIIGFVIQRL